MLYCEESSHPDIFDPSVQFLVNLWRFITKNVLCTAWHSFLSPGTQRWHSKSCSNESRLVVYQMPSFFTRYTCDHLGKTLTIVHVIEHWQKKHFFSFVVITEPSIQIILSTLLFHIKSLIGTWSLIKRYATICWTSNYILLNFTYRAWFYLITLKKQLW